LYVVQSKRKDEHHNVTYARMHVALHMLVEVIDGQFKLVSLPSGDQQVQISKTPERMHRSMLMQSIHMSWCLTPKLKSCVRAYVRVEHEVRGNLKSTCVCHRRSCIAELMADHMYYIYKSCPPVPVIRLLTSNYMMLTNFYICSLIWTPTKPMTKSLM